MTQAFFCRETVACGTSGGALYAILILGAFALWFAVRCLERGDLREFLRGMRGVWASWPPLFRVLAAVLLVCCTLDAQKPSGRAAGGDAAAEAGTDAAPRTDTVETPPAQTGGGAAARPLDGGGDGGLRTLGDGTNCWWVAEGRDPADADGDGMPDAWEAAHLPHLCPWLPDDTADADGDGLDNFHEHALGCDPGTPDTNGDGRANGEEAGEGVSPVLADADWAAYGTAEFSVRVQGLRAARRAGVSVGHVTHAGVSERTYALAAGYRYPVTVIDLDPDNTSACSGTVYIAHDTATFMHGFTNEFPVSFPLDPAAPACPPGTEMTVAGIDLDIPDIVQLASDNSVSFAVAARFMPDGEEIAGTPHWSVSGGSASPASGGMETWVTVTFPEPAARAPLDAGTDTNSPPAVTVEVGDRKVTREVYPPVVPDPEDPAPWDNRRFIARSPGDSDPVELTYALLLSTNAVPFAWRGEPGDTVLEWTFSKDGPRFLKDGQEVRTVTHAQSVSVLPKGRIDNFEITAKVLMARGGTVSRQTELRVVTVVAEPVTNPFGGPPQCDDLLFNPSGFCVGDTVCLGIQISDNVKHEHVRWLVDENIVTLNEPNGEKAPVKYRTVTGIASGQGNVRMEIENYWSPMPIMDFMVFDAPTVVPVHFAFLCDPYGTPFLSPAYANSCVQEANDIYRQAGIFFQVASVTNILDIFWSTNPPPGAITDSRRIQLCGMINQSEGLEVYFVPSAGVYNPASQRPVQHWPLAGG